MGRSVLCWWYLLFGLATIGECFGCWSACLLSVHWMFYRLESTWIESWTWHVRVLIGRCQTMPKTTTYFTFFPMLSSATLCTVSRMLANLKPNFGSSVLVTFACFSFFFLFCIYLKYSVITLNSLLDCVSFLLFLKNQMNHFLPKDYKQSNNCGTKREMMSHDQHWLYKRFSYKRVSVTAHCIGSPARNENIFLSDSAQFYWWYYC